MVQLWVNLPAANKMDPPHYQPLTAEQIGRVDLDAQGGSVRVVAGDFDGHAGPAITHTPINLWDVELNAGAVITPTIPADHNVAVLTLDGNVFVNGTDVPSGHVAILEPSRPGHDDVEITTSTGGRAARHDRPTNRRTNRRVRAIRDEHPPATGRGLQRLPSRSLRPPRRLTVFPSVGGRGTCGYDFRMSVGRGPAYGGRGVARQRGDER